MKVNAEVLFSGLRRRQLSWKSSVALVLFILATTVLGAGRSEQNQSDGSADDLLVAGGTVIDGTGRAPQERTSILVRDGRVLQVGGEEQLRRLSASPRILDAAGLYVLPGLIDSHVHYGDWGARLYLNHGVTSAFDIGNQTEWIIAQREGIRRKKIEGPRLFTTGNHLNGPPQAPGEARAGDTGGWATFVTDGPTARAAAERLVEQGVDAFKIQERLSEDSLRAIVAVAEARNIPVVGHTVNARDAALLGIRFVEHMRPIIRATVPDHGTASGERAAGDNPGDEAMDESRYGELIDLLVAEGVHINPTVFLAYLQVSRHREAYRAEDLALFPTLVSVPEYLKQRWLDYYSRKADEQTRTGYQKVARFLVEFVKRGGRLLSGTDSGRRLIPGLSLHREMELLVEAGISPLEVIRATTQYPAEFLGKQEEVGTIQAGRTADFLIVQGDPLSDISNTRRIAHVVKGGVIVDRSSHVYKNPIPRPVTEEVPPVLHTIEPVQFLQGEQGAHLVLKGEEFVPDSLVRIAGHTLSAVLLADSSLKVDVPSEITASIGTYPVSVFNPLPGGGTSNMRHFFVNFRYED